MNACFHCGESDHFARECPRLKPSEKASIRGGGPRGVPAVWCSYCDEDTRLVDLGDSMARCAECHPLRFQSLAQSRKCASCNATVYDWDHAPCGFHARPGVPLPRPATKGRPDSTRPAPSGGEN